MKEKDFFTEVQYKGAVKFSIRIKKTLLDKKTKFQRLQIFQTEKFGNLMVLDGYVMLTEKDEFVYHEMITHPALFSLKNPKRALVIGGGDGGTIREIIKHKNIKADLCEIDGEVIKASKKYFPYISCALNNKRVKIYVEDAIEFIKDKKNEYDLIVIDSTDPIGPGAGLFTREFYENVRSALKPEGIMTAQAENPWYDINILKSSYDYLKSLFKISRVYAGWIPTYPSGVWCFAMASKKYDPLKDFKKIKFKRSKLKLNYYNGEIHAQSFALPEFVKKALNQR